jgi:poly(3-hydroxybutyrate) depolymerase
MRSMILTFVVLVLFASPLLAQPPGSDHPGIWEQRVISVPYQGDVVDRLYYLYLPENYDQFPDRPLIVNLHGSIDTTQLDSAGQRPEVFMFGRQFTPQYLDTTRASMMWKVAEAQHVLVACPLSKGVPAWSPDDPTGNLEYVEAMLQDLEATYGAYIDSDRIYATGFSGGGGQTHRLGYYGGSRFAAIAPMYYPMNTALYPLNPPAAGPGGILFVANKYDPTVDVPYTEPSDSITVLQTAQKWAEWMNMDYAGGYLHTGPIDTVRQMKGRNMLGGGDGFCFMNFYTLHQSDGSFRHSYPKYDQTGFQGNVEVWNFLHWFYIPPSQSREAALDAGRVITPAPMHADLMNVYPNPFNAATTVSFTLEHPSMVSMSVVDVLGRAVATLAQDQRFAAGSHRVSFDGSSLSTGTYFVQADVGGNVQTQKLVLLK